ncbi:HNH endonuclease [Rhodococcus sp. AQ5-07]|uniref:HNH endonuclease n=1 Tax=Rhodococcus sp. AQ5-07 TaxID=2054902 RepID=UPI000DBF76DA|nr:HNH endonuclease signature motif containing protein [Rhodococcus sp. AQ5-07]RAL31642.1 hypothetical protein CVN56_26080 [Rhodococcus sp. AQ5-07]
MIGATKPNSDDAANYAHVAAHRKKNYGESLPVRLTPQVMIHYGSYGSRVMAAGGPQPHKFGAGEHDALKENANFLTHVQFSDLRRDVISAAVQKGRCAYCNQHDAGQVDHYLPKSKFGEYSIYSENLVPICSICNLKKLNRYKCEKGERLFLHPYFDRLPSGSVPFVKATLTFAKSVIIKFELVQIPGIGNDIWKILRNQFEALGLPARYTLDATREMQSMKDAFYVYYSRGGDTLVDYIQVQLGTKSNAFGPNHWLPVMLKAIAESKEFCSGGFKKLGPPTPI